jgi:hypothetical protein
VPCTRSPAFQTSFFDAAEDLVDADDRMTTT